MQCSFQERRYAELTLAGARVEICGPSSIGGLSGPFSPIGLPHSVSPAYKLL